MKRLLLAGIAAGACASGALAADLGPYRPPPPAEPIYEPAPHGAWNWQGLYLGVNAGYGWGKDNATLRGLGGGGGTLSPDGWFGGGQIGYNAQFNSLVLGLEADLQRADIGDTTVLSGGQTLVTTDIEWFSTVRGRLGYAAGPALVYVTGGWAFADLRQGVASPTTFAWRDGWETGYTVGGGVEWAFSPNWSLKSEYLYVDLGNQTLSSPAGTYKTETDFHTARVGLNYRF
jgi:outer membrane immunogenic protein